MYYLNLFRNGVLFIMGNYLRYLIFFLSISFSHCYSHDIVYSDFDYLISIYDVEEASQLRVIFNSHRPIDLERSGFHSTNQFINEVKTRLSEAIELEGKYTSQYFVYIVDSDKKEGYIYKRKPYGQNFYRGHVVVSTAMLKSMSLRIGDDIRKFNTNEFTYFVKGIIGVLAHEFSHPKQDELVKWRIREGGIDTLSTLK